MTPSTQSTLLGNHQRCWIWGRHLIDTTLLAGRWPILELCLSDRLPPDRLAGLQATAHDRGIATQVVAPERLTRLCRHADHQGVAAKMTEFPYSPIPETLGRPPACQGPILFLDGIQDAFNVGAILRSADVFGVQGVCLAMQAQAGITSMTARASAGAVNHLPISRVPDAGELIDELRRAAVQIIGASEKGQGNPDAIDWSRPSMLIMGNEARGIRPDLLGRCDALASIPQRPGAINSLNVAAAAAVLLYEAARHRNRQHPAL